MRKLTLVAVTTAIASAVMFGGTVLMIEFLSWAFDLLGRWSAIIGIGMPVAIVAVIVWLLVGAFDG